VANKGIETQVREHIVKHMKINNIFTDRHYGFISLYQEDQRPYNC